MTQKFISLVFNFLFLCFLSVSCQASTQHHRHRHHHHHHHHHRHGHSHDLFRPQKLFVFGDSYADTGNTPKASFPAWKVPYGVTFPGKPTGRFSDGRVFPDFVAKFYRIRSPIPYKFRSFGPEQARRYGMNFAIGGTGVFETLVSLPNMTVQIDMLQEVIANGTYTAADLQSSLALVSLSGNDYSAYLLGNGSFEALPAFIEKIVNQLTINIKRIHGLGIKKVAVADLAPLGCLPYITNLLSPGKCFDFIDPFVKIHNQLLTKSVAGLNNGTGPGQSTFVVIDLYDSFKSVIDRKGKSTFRAPLEPCCVGVNSSYVCGDVDRNGAKMYKVCPSPGSMFFWDMVHPTQQGWKAVFASLSSTFNHLQLK